MKINYKFPFSFAHTIRNMIIHTMSGRYLFPILFVLFFFSLIPNALIATTLSGSLSEDEIWSGTINLTGDVTVPEGITLTIGDETTIVFPAGIDDQAGGADATLSELIVKGSLLATGSAASPITFTSSASTPAKGDWGGIRMSGDGALTLSHVVVEYGLLGVNYQSAGGYSEVHITDSTIRQTSGVGIYVYVSSGTARTVEVSSNHVHDHSGEGIYVRGSGANTVLNGTVSGNEVHATGNSGLYFYLHGAARSELIVDSNTVYTTQNHGIYGYAVNASTVMNGVFTNNEISGTATGLYLYVNSSATSQSLILQANTIHNTSTGLYCNSGYAASMSPVISDNNLYENSSVGMDFYGSRGNLKPLIRHNQATGNGIGIRVRWYYDHTVRPTIILNTVTGNTGVGVSVQCNGAPVILHNDIQGNGGNGLTLNSSSTSYVHYNNISNNSGSRELSNTSASVVDARYNWWGAQATGQMDGGDNPKNISRIYDIFDDGSKGGVDYSEWLSSAQTLSTTPISWLLDPADGSSFKGGVVRIHGAAVSRPGIERVEVSTDNGQSWQVASGTSLWSYEWTVPADDTYILQSRVISSDSTLEQPSGHHTVTVDIDAMTVSGTLEHDETWSGEVFIEGDVIVPVGVTLTILPGATSVYMPTLHDGTYDGDNNSKSEIIINGTLLVEGSVDNPIVFTSTTAGGGKPGDWRGITVNGALSMKYVDLQHAETGITFKGTNDQAQLSVTNSTISNCSNHGVNILAANSAQVSVVVEDTIIANNGGYGITSRAANESTSLQFNFCNNTFADNGDIGLYVYADGSSGDPIVSGNICNNTIVNHITHGVSLYTYHGARSQITVENNNVYQSAKGFDARYNTSHPDSTLTVTSNDFHTGLSGLSIHLDTASLTPLLESNQAHGHTGDGVFISHGGQAVNILLPQLLNNQVYDNDGRGISLQPTSDIVMSNNGMFSNIQYDLYNNSSFAIDASGNWWGVNTTNIINSANNPINLSVIYDSFDNAAKGTVDYSDWLTLYDPPSVPTLDPVVSPTDLDIQTLAGTKEADSGIMINGTVVIAPNQETSWSYDLVMAEGRNSLSFRARTASGMVSAAVYASIIKDSTAPKLYSSVPADGAYMVHPVVRVDFTLLEESTSIDPLASSQGSVINQHGMEILGSWNINSNILSFAPDIPFEDGLYTLTITPTDQPLGNSQTESISFTVDLLPPSAPGLSPPDSPTNASQAVLFGTKDPDSSVWMDFTEIVSLNNSSTWSYVLALAEGANSHTLYSRDLAGNKGGETTFTIVSDRTAPVLSATEPQDSSFVAIRPESISFTFTEQHTSLDEYSTLSTAEIFNSSGADVPGTWGFEGGKIVHFTPAQPFAEDQYHPRITARDQVGNGVASSFSFTYDGTPPFPPTLQPVQSPTNFLIQTLSGTKDINSSIRLNGQEIIAVNSESTWSYGVTLEEGTNTFSINSADRAGNRSNSISASIQYDETAPLSVQNLTVDAEGSGTEVAMSWIGYNEAIQGDIQSYRVYIADTLFTQVAAMTPVVTLPAGTFTYTATEMTRGTRYYFAVVAVDNKGNAHSSVTPVSAIVKDVEAPEPVTNLRALNNGTTLTFSWDHSLNTVGDLSNYRFIFDTRDAEEIASTQNSRSVSNLAAATGYPCSVIAVDAEGNESAATTVTGVTVLPNPAELSGIPQSGYVSLAWPGYSMPEHVKYYAVYVSETEFTSVQGMEPKLISITPSAKVARLTNGTPYFLGVITVNISNGFQNGITSFSTTPSQDQEGPEFGNILADEIPLYDGIIFDKGTSISAQASDPISVSRIEFYLDTVRMATDYLPTGGFYSWFFDISRFEDGVYQLSLKAYDSLGNSSEQSFSVSVALAPPTEPTLTLPDSGMITNREQLVVSGNSGQGATVSLYNNDVEIATDISVNHNGDFRTEITLDEGENRLQAIANNRAGQSGFSNTILVTLDTSLPSEPQSLAVAAKAGGEVKLTWRAPAGEDAGGYYVYRQETAFSTMAQAQKITPKKVTGTNYSDLTPQDKEWFYRVSTVDLADNEGLLSNQASVVSDRVAPKALSVTANAYGKTSGERIAPGRIDISVTVSEELLAPPFISIIPNGGTPYAVQMKQDDESNYSGTYILSESTPSGTAYVLFSCRDIAGNRGTEIDSAASLVFDTDGPNIQHLVVTPSAPIQNDAQPEITVRIGLSESIKSGQTPELSYRLSGPAREITAIATPVQVPPVNGEAEAWQTVFTLPLDGGLEETETLTFFYTGQDDLDNLSTKIEAVNQFQVYQGELPPLETPVGLKASALPGGRVQLTWELVEGAVDYQLYRRSETEAEMLPLVRSNNISEYEDQTSEDGLYFYAVASVRDVAGEESLSGLSSQVSVATDSTIPDAPQKLGLQLTPQGIRLDWQPPTSGDSISYALYRSADPEITSVAGLTPLARGIEQIMVIDPTPSITEHCYAVTAEDSIGNESLPSNSAYNNFELLPVTSFHILQQGTDSPVLTWQHPNHANLSGYNLYLEKKDAQVALSEQPLTGRTYTDTGYTGAERQYILKAVDNNNFESLGRTLFMPQLRAELLPDSRLERGLMNRLTFRVKNLENQNISNIRLHVEIEGRTHLSDTFSLTADEFQLIQVTVGGYNDLSDLCDIVVHTIITPNPGEQIELVRQDQIDVFDGMLVLQLGNEEFVRGVTGTVWFRLENSGEEEIEIITAKNNGKSDSKSISYQLLDNDGNVVVTAGFRQGVGTEVVTLPNGNVVTRIQAGKSFTSEPTVIQIPSGTPDELTVRLSIADIYYHHSKEDEVHMDGLAGEFPIVLLDTSYYGEISEVTPALSTGDEDILITGQALERESGDPLAGVPLNLVITLNGFERSVEVLSDDNGNFSHTFTPLAGESGRYKLRIVHPDLLDKPIHGQFVITRVIVIPETVNLSVPRSYEQSFAPKVRTGAGTELTNLRLLYQAADQPGGMLAEGVHVSLNAPVSAVSENSKVTLPLSLWADNRAADTGQLVLRVVSDESDAAGWGTVTVNTAFSSADPVLNFAPFRVETGVMQSDAVTETVTLDNKGLAALVDVRLSLTDLAGNVAPSWVRLNISNELGDMEVGEKRDVPITFSPDATVTEGAYQFQLQVESANYPTTPIYLFVVVNLDGLGDALFKVSDIYTATLNAQNELIQGLADAKLTLQNEKTLVSAPVRYTDAIGEAAYSDLPAGQYKYRLTASNHQEVIGRIVIKPGAVATESIFMDYNLVTVSWEVNEITIEDRYEIVLSATYETDVPAPVVVVEPISLAMPAMKDGAVYNGEFVVKNYGLVRADDLKFQIPASDANFKFELLEGLPDALEAKQSITIPYRITCLKSLDQDEGSGGGCYTYRRCVGLSYCYKCANGTKAPGAGSFCYTYTYGVCGSVASGGIISGGSWGISSGGVAGAISSPAPLPQPISGEECLNKPDRDCTTCECKAASSEAVGSTVDTLMREYNRDDEDLAVQVKGGKISAHRYYERNSWHWKFNRDNLTLEYDGAGSVRSIIRHNGTYKVSLSDPTLFRHSNYTLRQSDTGFRWSDKKGNWKEYDPDGQLLSYGSRNQTFAKALYVDNAFTGWTDGDDNQVLWYEYVGDYLSAVSDISGRRVEYNWSGENLSAVTDVRGYVTSYGYANGNLVRVEEPGGKVRNITYGRYGDVRSVKDDQGVGHVFEFDYDKGRREYYSAVHYTDGRLKERWYNYDGDLVRRDMNGVTEKSILRDSRTRWITNDRGFVTKEELDEWDNVIRTEYPDETWETKEYSQPWNRLIESDRMGIITKYEYDSNGYMSAKVEAVGTDVERRTEFVYSASGKLLTTTLVNEAGENVVTTYSYDEYDNLLSITDPEGRVTSFLEYDITGRPLTIEDGRGFQRHLEYDAAGNLRFTRDHNNELLSELRYDEAGNRASAVNALLKEFKFRYDTNGRLLETEDPYGNIKNTEYSTTGKVILTEDEEHLKTRREYDSFDRLAKIIDGEGNEISYEYLGSDCSSCGANSDLVSRIVYPTFSREMEYDSRSRVIMQTDVVSVTEERVTSFSYNEYGNMETVTDPLGQITRYEYDALHRKISETGALGEVTRYIYNTQGNLIRLEDPNLGDTLFVYDLSGRLLKETKPLLQETSYEYDENGNLVSLVDALNHKIVHSYDAFNRLQKTDYFAVSTDSTPVKTVSYSFNKLGSLIGYDDSITSATYEYDDLQRPIGETVNYPDFSLAQSYSYYANSQKKSYTDPAGRIRTWSYDQAGRSTALNLGAAGVVSTNAYTWNRPSMITLPGGSTLNYSYNGLQEMKGLVSNDPGGNPLIDYAYAYSLAGQVTEKSTEKGNYGYGYDAVSQLTSVESPVGEEAYSYDPLGNRLTSTEYDDWGYDDNNRLQSFGSATFNYDNNGNMLRKSIAGVITDFTYTVDNRLQSVDDGAGGLIADYYYDPFGRRLWKDVAGVRTFFYYNDEGLVGEYGGSGGELRTYGYHTGAAWSSNPLFVQEGGEYYWYQNDHLGTPQKVVAGNGSVVWSALYDSFGGAVVGVETVRNNLRFPGQYFDSETGLHYNWHRFYDPATGRYISADPIGLQGGINLYAYANANPIMFIDPMGLAPGGCGSWWNDWAVPEKPGGNDYSSCCQEHDDCYGECGKTKEECDDAFYKCMARKCKQNFGGKKCLKWANRYWGAVDEHGGGAYEIGQNPDHVKEDELSGP